MTYYEYTRQEQEQDLLEDHAIGLYSRAYKEIELDQPLWTHHRLKQIFDRTHHHLSQLQTAINTAVKQDLRHVLPEKQYSIRMKTVRQRRLELLGVIKEELEASDSNVRSVQNQILSVTEPRLNRGNDTDNLRKELRLQECRTLLRNADTPDKRKQIINDALKNNNEDFLAAAITAPDRLLSSDSLLEIRRARAFERSPTLRQAEEDSRALRNRVRRVCGRINSTSIAQILKGGLEKCPITRQEHFQVFIPRTEHEINLAAKLIEKEEEEAEKKVKFEAWQHDNLSYAAKLTQAREAT